MTVSLFLATCAAALTSAAAPAPLWRTDYLEAVQAAERLDRPLVVIVGRGPDGWRQLLGGVPLEDAAQKLLAAKFVCLYLDRNNPVSLSQSQDFGAGDEPLLVVSDRSRKLQNVKRKGQMPPAELTRTLESQFVVQTVQPVEHRSYYQPTPQPVQGYVPMTGNPFGGGVPCNT